MLEACLDESGIHNGSLRCVVAGYVGGVRQWTLFSRDWTNLMKEYGVINEIGHPDFKANRFFAFDQQGNRVDYYAGWSNEKSLRFMEEMAHILFRRNLHPIGAGVDIPAFNALGIAERQWLTGAAYSSDRNKWTSTGAPNTPYFLAFQFAIIQSIPYAKFGIKINFIFDQQKQFSSLALSLYDQMIRLRATKQPERMGTISFASRYDVIGLQASDLISFVHYQYNRDTKAFKKSALRHALDHLLAKENNIKFFDAPTMQAILERQFWKNRRRNPS